MTYLFLSLSLYISTCFALRWSYGESIQGEKILEIIEEGEIVFTNNSNSLLVYDEEGNYRYGVYPVFMPYCSNLLFRISTYFVGFHYFHFFEVEGEKVIRSGQIKSSSLLHQKIEEILSIANKK